MARVTVEDCLDKVPNRFALVVLAAERARQLSRGAVGGSRLRQQAGRHRAARDRGRPRQVPRGRQATRSPSSSSSAAKPASCEFARPDARLKNCPPLRTAPNLAGCEGSNLRDSRGELVRALYRLGRQSASGILTLTPTRLAARRGVRAAARRGRRRRWRARAQALVARLVRLVALDGVARRVRGRHHRVSARHDSTRSRSRRWARAHLEAAARRHARRCRSCASSPACGCRCAPSSRPSRDLRRGRSPDARRDGAAAPARSDLAARAHAAVPPARVPPLPARGRRARRRGRGRRASPRRRASSIRAARRAPRCSASPRTPTSRRSSAPIAGSRATLHPDLQPEADAPRRRALERRFAEVTAAYEALL